MFLRSHFLSILFTLSSLIFALTLKAQISKPYETLPKTPDASLFARIETFNSISESGSSSLEIPLGQISLKNITVPIQLQYSNSGIRVTDVETPIGLGWVLNAGSIISRSIGGIPDEDGWIVDRPNLSQGCWTQSMISDFYLNNRDYSPDIFSYTINGKSGHFFFNEQGEINKSLNLDNLKISISSNTTNFGFKVLDENGNTYYFEKTEHSDNNTIGNNFNNNTKRIAPTLWKITEIITPLNEKIIFEYENYTFNTPNYTAKNTFTLKYDGQTGLEKSEFETTRCYDTYSIQLVKSIKSKEDSIAFEYINDPLLSICKKKLKSIKFINKLTKTAIKTIDMIHNTTNNNRIILDTILIYGDNKNKKPIRYSFEYNRSFFEYGTIYKDIFGYYSKKCTGYGIPYNKGNGLTPKYQSIKTYVSESDRSPDGESIKFCSLKKITYPTGAYAEIETEPNINTANEIPTYAPGLRTKKVSFFNLNNNLERTQEYEYGNLTGNYFAGNFTPYFSGTLFWEGAPSRYQGLTKWSSEPIIFERSENGFGYDSIKVIDKIYYPTKSTTSNQSTSHFITFYGALNQKSILGYKDLFDEKNKKIRREIYNYTGRNLKTINFYEITDSYIFSGLYTDCDNQIYCSITGNCQGNQYTYYAPLKQSCFNSTSDICKINEKIIEYTNKYDSIINYKTFEYNDNLQIAKTTTKSSYSNNIQIVNYSTYYKYPSDYSTTIDWINQLKSKNIISTPISIRKYININNNEKIINAELYQYSTNGLLTKEFKYIFNNTPIEPWNENVFLHNNFIKISEYEYDTITNNIIQYTDRSGITHSLLWGYNDLYPIIKAKNLKHSVLKDASINLFPNTITENDFLNQIRTIQSIISKNHPKSQITGFFFKPGIGIALEVDNNGNKKQFSYDSFGRLEGILNNESKYINHYKYRYYNDFSNDNQVISDIFNCKNIDLFFDGGGESQDIEIESTQAWNIISKSSSFIICEKTNNNNLKVSCTVLKGTRNRTGTITISNGIKSITISITQIPITEEEPDTVNY